jgi:hypothetical protein
MRPHSPRMPIRNVCKAQCSPEVRDESFGSLYNAASVQLGISVPQWNPTAFAADSRSPIHDRRNKGMGRLLHTERKTPALFSTSS